MAAAPAVARRDERLLALDLMRGLVMVLMAIDHSSDAFNAGRVFTDSVAFYRPGTALPTAQFLVRWITHCARPRFCSWPAPAFRSPSESCAIREKASLPSIATCSSAG